MARRAGARATPAGGARLLRAVGDVVRRGEPLFEVHAQSQAQITFALDYARAQRDLVRLGF